MNKHLCVKRNVSFVDAQRCVKGCNGGVSLPLSLSLSKEEVEEREEEEEERKEGSR